MELRTSSLSRTSIRIGLSVILLLFLIYGYLSEKILPADGFGFDGAFYGDMTINLKDYLKNKTINKYYFQRVGVPLVIHYVFQLFHVTLSKANVILGFELFNYCCIGLSVFYYFLISNFLKFSKSAEAVGFSCLFFGFAILKFCGYYPVLMDIPAFGIAIVMVYYYLKQNPWVFFSLVFLGSFVYPTFIILSILFWFKKEDVSLNTDNALLKSPRAIGFLKRADHLFIKFLFCFSLPVFLVIIYIVLFWRNSFELMSSEFSINPSNTIYIWSSFVLALIYLFYFNFYSGVNYSIKKLAKSLNFFGIALTIFTVLLVQFLINRFASHDDVPLTLKAYLYNIIFQGVKNPMNFFVAHVYYFGVLFLISLLFSKSLKQEIKKFGFGAIIFFNVFFFFSVGNESRQLINYYPFFVILVIITLYNSKRLHLLSSVFIIITNVILSHFWYTINRGLSITTDYTNYFKMFDFPLQRYFKFQGPWVSDASYKIHLWVCITLLIVLFLLFRKLKPTRSKEEDLQ